MPPHQFPAPTLQQRKLQLVMTDAPLGGDVAGQRAASSLHGHGWLTAWALSQLAPQGQRLWSSHWGKRRRPP